MNLEVFCKKYQLGNVKQMEKITGGLLHKMWKVETDQGLYAIKILNPEIMKKKDAYDNFIKAEEISNLAKKNKIQVSSAINIRGNCLNQLEGFYYMVFEYVNGKTLRDEEITTDHCRKIAQVLAKIHSLDDSSLKQARKVEKYQRLYPWEQYIENKNFQKMPYKDLFLANYKKYNSLLKRANKRFNESNQIQTIYHRDLDPKNVLWQEDQPIIIDWESAGFMNPYRELIEVALSWSGFLSNQFDPKKFEIIIKEYIKYRKFEHKRYSTICGNLVGRFGWLKYNLERSLGNRSQEKEEIELAKEEVSKTILEINRYVELIGPMYQMVCHLTKKENRQYDPYIEKLVQNVPLLKGKRYEKVNAGFTNTIYRVEDYIVRICNDLENEQRFQNEIEFYNKNKKNKGIPKLYMADTTKKLIPYSYQILEKIDGKTMYEVWYQLSEEERKRCIQKIIAIVKKIHHIKGTPYNFKEFIKNELENELRKSCLENEKYEKVIAKCDLYFQENIFGMIHGDLHFDNLLYKNGKIYLLDFEGITSAPIDYEFKILNRCRKKPWLWASENTDMLAVEEDYRNLMPIIIENYEELRNIPYLKERLAIYELIEDLKEYNRTKEAEILNEIECEVKILTSAT